MAIYRTVKTKYYTMISNELLRDKTLSPHAKLIMVIILSLKDSDNCNVRRLSKLCGLGQDAVRTAMQELISKGFALRRRERINGQYGKMLYDFFEVPSLNAAWCAAPGHEVPAQEKPQQAEPAQENTQNIYNTNHINNTNINNINLYHINHSINQEMEDRIRHQIEYDVMCERYDSRMLDDLVAVMVNVMVEQNVMTTVSKTKSMPTDYVRGCISKITSLHVEQIMETLQTQQPVIRNMHGYLLTALINAANTMSMVYQYGDY